MQVLIKISAITPDVFMNAPSIFALIPSVTTEDDPRILLSKHSFISDAIKLDAPFLQPSYHHR